MPSEQPVIIEVRCTICDWNGRIQENEIDEACPSCHGFECLAQIGEDE